MRTRFISMWETAMVKRQLREFLGLDQSDIILNLMMFPYFSKEFLRFR